MMYDQEVVKGIILGTIKYRKCPSCDNNGRIYWDGQTGMGESSSPSNIDPEWLDYGTCPYCEGLGYILTGS